MKMHTYYQVEFKLISPMNISSGENINTDADVLVDRYGLPFIPGSTLAGLLRSMMNPQEKEKLFGTCTDDDDSFNESPVIIYDAKLREGTSFRREQRDHVKLNKYRTVEKKFKFDEECIEPGAEFVGYLEMNGNTTKEQIDLLEQALGKLAARKCGFGRKTTRGFGRAEMSAKKRSFDLEKEDERTAWLDFSPFDKASFTEAEPVNLGAYQQENLHIRLQLQLQGGISIRVYLTDPNPNGKEKNVADYITLHSDGKPAVPGSSWAGAFRHRYQELAEALGNKEAESELFGFAEEKEGHRSRISFSETILEGSQRKTMTRNAIDRASGKTKDSALYTEETSYGGTGELDILIDRNVSTETMQLFGACLCDFIHGYLAVGGLSSIGRGSFMTKALEIQGEPFQLTESDWENQLIAAVKGATEK